MEEADVFYRQLPKVELHAHLNGSVSFSTIEKLVARKPHLNIEHGMTAIRSGQRRTLDECFQVFKVIHQLVDTEEDILMVAKDVIREFAADGVKYLELRSTPRKEKTTGMTKRRYVETVIEAIRQCKNEGVDIEVRFLVAVDRRNGAEVAMETVKLAEDFMLSTGGLVVGLDLSGDPMVGHGRDLLPALQKAKNCGLKLSLHLSEVPSQADESELLLNIPPDRIGHGTFLHPEVGGSQSLVDKVRKHNTPLDRRQGGVLHRPVSGVPVGRLYLQPQSGGHVDSVPEGDRLHLRPRPTAAATPEVAGATANAVPVMTDRTRCLTSMGSESPILTI
ncbi:adenosine deaminase-like protein isoform X6 [Oncorhynchus mykiss]|uniref:adenosine deaminase-like protein isoform X6 n=1 Tax=Oncorhynchus mykiss TaxID=8022 RepID=UPI001635C184|nr:adenosine deaminase-like protein isoform X6 [Oncorhynchus mykiss]